MKIMIIININNNDILMKIMKAILCSNVIIKCV